MTTTRVQERCFADAKTNSEMLLQNDLSNASSAENYDMAVKRAREANWSRIIAAATANNMRSTPAEFALSQSRAGKTP